MKLYRWSVMEKEQMNPGVARQVIHTDRMTIARVHLQKGGIVAGHRHPNEQVTMLEQGRLCFTIEGQSTVLEPGCILHIPSGAFHQVEALEDSVAVDVFTPPREDWIRGEDAYLRS
jgi:quercetin dioxygenase-like cupin family protein